jgi:hypothetical protein
LQKILIDYGADTELDCWLETSIGISLIHITPVLTDHGFVTKQKGDIRIESSTDFSQTCYIYAVFVAVPEYFWITEEGFNDVVDDR